tara:strand:- start:109 stop:615 length:507 start_codon:yes stop_codon:yes gene_type:complete
MNTAIEIFSGTTSIEIIPNPYIKMFNISSLFFFSPILLHNYYLYNNPLSWLMTITSMFTGLTSLNYWLEPTPGLRRIIDNIFVKISTLIFVTIFLKYLSLKYKIILSINLSLIIFCYIFACIRYSYNCSSWIPFHFCVHLISAISMTAILYLYNVENNFKDIKIDLLQ